MEAETPAAVIQDNLFLPVPCDLCDWAHSWHFLRESRQFGSGNVWVCGSCGFVVVPKTLRRSSEEIAAAWGDIYGEGYTSRWPAVEARLNYVAEWFDQRQGWKGKHVLEIGAGEGRFLQLVSARGAQFCAGIEPSQANVDKIQGMGFEAIRATAETAPVGNHYFDVVAILWTLENCSDCIKLLEIAKKFLCQGGSLIIGTGSRILVPFKKPLSAYFSKNPPDTHSFRFSAKSLSRALQKSGFNHVEFNDYMQCDWLVAEAQVRKHVDKVYASHDDPEDVLAFFRKWAEQWP